MVFVGVCLLVIWFVIVVMVEGVLGVACWEGGEGMCF